LRPARTRACRRSCAAASPGCCCRRVRPEPAPGCFEGERGAPAVRAAGPPDSPAAAALTINALECSQCFAPLALYTWQPGGHACRAHRVLPCCTQTQTLLHPDARPAQHVAPSRMRGRHAAPRATGRSRATWCRSSRRSSPARPRSAGRTARRSPAAQMPPTSLRRAAARRTWLRAARGRRRTTPRSAGGASAMRSCSQAALVRGTYKAARMRVRLHVC